MRDEDLFPPDDDILPSGPSGPGIPERSSLGSGDPATRAEERREELLDQLASLRKAGLYALFALATAAALALTAVAAIALYTFATHLFIPQLGWLTEQQQTRLTSWYGDVAKVAFPVVLLVNSWLIWYATQRNR